jgi:hypothetical protein
MHIFRRLYSVCMELLYENIGINPGYHIVTNVVINLKMITISWWFTKLVYIPYQLKTIIA